MSIIDNFGKYHRNCCRIAIVFTLVTVLTLGTTLQSGQQSNALDIDKLSDFKGLSDLGLSNNCVAFECNNQQTVDNSKTIRDNTNSNIISESDSAYIDITTSNSSQPNPPLTCVDCFEKANLTPEQEQELFSIFVDPVSSYRDICLLLSQDTSAASFKDTLIQLAELSEEQADIIVDCLVDLRVITRP